MEKHAGGAEDIGRSSSHHPELQDHGINIIRASSQHGCNCLLLTAVRNSKPHESQTSSFYCTVLYCTVPYRNPSTQVTDTKTRVPCCFLGAILQYNILVSNHDHIPPMNPSFFHVQYATPLLEGASRHGSACRSICVPFLARALRRRGE
jgi:hypothetical protein